MSILIIFLVEIGARPALCRFCETLTHLLPKLVAALAYPWPPADAPALVALLSEAVWV